MIILAFRRLQKFDENLVRSDIRVEWCQRDRAFSLLTQSWGYVIDTRTTSASPVSLLSLRVELTNTVSNLPEPAEFILVICAIGDIYPYFPLL